LTSPSAKASEDKATSLEPLRELSQKWSRGSCVILLKHVLALKNMHFIQRLIDINYKRRVYE